MEITVIVIGQQTGESRQTVHDNLAEARAAFHAALFDGPDPQQDLLVVLVEREAKADGAS